MSEHPTNVIPFKRRLSSYSYLEREIIAMIERDGHPLTQGWINLYLAQARSIHGDDLSG
jgi:hypothetical protein